MTLTVPECAKQLNVVPHSIRKWIWSGALPATKVRRGREQWTYLVNAEDWQRFVARRAEGRLSDPPPITADPQSEPDAVRQSHGFAFFAPVDLDDRAVKQAALMRKALRGCKASRETLRHAPFHLAYWMAVDGAKKC